MSARGVASVELLQQLQRQVKNLTVEKLKKILRNSSLAVTGTKPVLVEKIINELNHRSQMNDAQRFTRLRQLIQNPDNPPALLSHASPAYESTSSYNTSAFGAVQANGGSTGSYSSVLQRSQESGSAMKFKSSPFYTVSEMIGHRRQLDAREQNREILQFTFRLRGDMLDRIRRDHRCRVLLYSGTDDILRSPSDIAFPSNFDLKINSSEVKANFKGLKNKPGTTRPVDVTALVSQSANQDNHVWLTWAVTTRKFHLAFYLARQHDPMDLVQRLKEAKRISKSSVLAEMSAWSSDSDLVATSSRMSLKCPLSTMRISTPCRSRICKHNQCFDALAFLQLQEQAPQWNCPVCNKHVPFEILQVDEYVNEILNGTPQSAEQVSVGPDGHWSLMFAEQEDPRSSSRTVKREETEMSDDVVEILESPRSRSPQGTSILPLPHRENTIAGVDRQENAPFTGSGAKRSASEIIDLTADTDDEDEQPIRPPAKRQAMEISQGNTWGQAPYRPAHGPPRLSEYDGFAFPVPSKSNQLSSGPRFGN